MIKIIKCLVEEAEKKCQCENCKNQRKYIQSLMESQAKVMVFQIYMNALDKAGVFDNIKIK